MIRKLLIFILILSCVAAWRAYLFDLGNPYIVGDDARLVLLGVLRFSDPDLFPNDLLVDYAEYFVTPGVKFLYLLSSGLVDPIAFSKILSFSILVISAFFLFKLMYEITSSKTFSILAVLFFISVSTFKVSISGGFPRSFAILLTICFLYFLIKKSWFKVFATLALSSLLHPISFLLCYGTFILGSISVHKKAILIDKDKKRTIALIASLAFGALVLVPQNMLYSSPYIGKTMNPALAKTEAVYYEGGRPGSVSLPTPNLLKASYQQLISPFALNSKVKLLDQNGFSKEKSIITRLFFCFVILLVFMGMKNGLKIIPKEVACYLLSGMALYLVADAIFIKIYFPERYLLNFGLISLIIVFSTLNVFFRFLDSIHVKYLSFLTIFFVALAIFLSSNFTSSIGMNNYFYDKPVLNYLTSLPKDIVITSFPMGIADNIPLFSKRKVFIFYEASNPFHVQHWNLIKERTKEFFLAYYSDDLSKIERFMEFNNIDYFLVDMDHFKEDFLLKDKIYFNPFSKQILQTIQGKESFALQKISSKDQDFRWKDKYVISLKRIKMINDNNER